MSGIAGYYIFRPSANRDRSGTLAAMLNELGHQDVHEVKPSYEEAPIAMGGTVTHGVDNVNGWDDDEVTIVFQGKLTNKKTLEQDLLLCRPEGASTESIIIRELYFQKGKHTPSFLKGRFCFALWDKEKKQLLIATDRYGYGYLYYYKNADWIVFATEIKAILRVINQIPDPNINGICDLYNFHAVYNNDTPFGNIFLMPYASCFLCSQNQVILEKYWEYPNNVYYFRENEEDLIQEAKKIISSAVYGSIEDHENFGILISGGLDSRLISSIAHLCHPEKQIKLFYVDMELKHEMDIVHNMSQTLGLPLEVVGYENEVTDLYSYLDDQTYLTDGQGIFYDFIPKIERLGKCNKGIALSHGYLLDTMFKSGFAFFPKDNQDKLIVTTRDYEKRFSFFNGYAYETIFTPDFSRTLRERKKERIEEANEGFEAAPPTEASLRFYCTNRGRRGIYYGLHLFENFVHMALPGIDYDLQDFAWRLPYHLRNNSRFYRRIICELFPVLGDIPWDRTGRPLWYDGKGNRKKFDRLEYIVKYAMQRATRGYCDLLHSRNNINRRFRQDKSFRDQVCAILRDKKTISRGLLNRDGVENLIDLEMSGRDLGQIFRSILSVEFLFRRFF